MNLNSFLLAKETKVTMSTTAIRWGKKYYEELGEKDQEGFYEYAYRYYLYIFYLPGGNKIRIKRYMDTSDECSLFFVNHFFNLAYKLIDEEFIKAQDGLSAIIAFMRVTQVVSQFYYFNGDYKPFNSEELKEDSKDYFFVEMTVEEYAASFDKDILP